MLKEFISVAEAAKKWDISVRRVQLLCNQGRIADVIKLGRIWGIPKDAEKPSDQRHKIDKTTEKEQLQSASMQKQPLPDFVGQNPYFSVYPCDKMTIFATKKPAPLFKGEFSHSSYEFIITQSPVAGMILSGEKMDSDTGMLLAINSEQMHGTRFLISDVQFISIQFEKAFLEELLYGVYGIKEARFDNTPNACGNEIQSLVDAYIEEYDSKKEGYVYILGNLSVQLAVAIFRQTEIAGRVSLSTDQNAFIKKAIAFLKTNADESFSLEALSDAANMSKFNFARKFKRMTGKTPYEYFMDIRIMNALEYLSNPHYKVIDVALQCGFKNHSHFSQQFRLRTGMTPKEYRKKILRQ
jgi:AraC-like DNA-binding protein